MSTPAAVREAAPATRRASAQVGPVVVGVDGSAGSLIAARWAAMEAHRVGAPLLVAHVIADQPDYPPWLRAQRVRAANEVVQRSLELLTAAEPEAVVRSTIESGKPATALVELARDGALLVVGSRGLGAFGRLLLGSTSTAVLHRSPVPTALVPPSWHEPIAGAAPTVVVGVDDGAGCGPALGFAFAQAARTGAEITALYVLELPPVSDLAGYAGSDDIARWETAVDRMLDERIAPWSDRYPDVKVRTVIRHGHPVASLVDEAAHAQMLVVGCRGHSPITPLSIGSVARGVAQHTLCPVVVVPDERE